MNELRQLRAMNVNEIRIMKAFQYRLNAREKIPAEVAAEIYSHAESTALLGSLEVGGSGAGKRPLLCGACA